MKKLSLLIFICFFSQSINAQVWCTPGSQWYFSHNSYWQTGYIKADYLNNTMIAGKNCNVIRINTIGYQYGLGPINTTEYIYIHLNNGVVYIKDVMQPGSNNFDTLYNFNAAIGSKWRMAPISETACSISFVTVLDTGRNTIQGQSLKWLKVNYQNSWPSFPYPNFNDTIYERIGALNVYPYWPWNICPPGTDLGAGGAVRCFSDYQIINYKHNWPGNCNNYFTSLAENNKNSFDIKIFPNPNTGILNIETEWTDENTSIRIENTLGQTVLSEKVISKKSSYNLSHLQSGVYFVTLKQNEHFKTTKLIKQ